MTKAASAKRPNSGLLHPVTWWVLSLLITASAILASQLSPLIVLAISAVLVSIIFEPSWLKTMRFYLLLALLVLITRLLFRFLFNYGSGEAPILLELPLIELNIGFGGTVSLLGSISQAAFDAALIDGLRLATIVLSIGMATTLCHPRKLLKSTPGALYEIAATVSMAMNLAPQLVTSAQRVKQARGLRGRSRGIGSMTGIVIPVLEDTIENSMNLAASMSSRGFGRTGNLGKLERMLIRTSSIGAVSLMLIGTFFALSFGVLNPLATGALILGFSLSIVSLKVSSARITRTALSSRKPGVFDFAALLLGALMLIGISFGWWNS
jgi:energy-coupling factor transport system permease protein